MLSIKSVDSLVLNAFFFFLKVGKNLENKINSFRPKFLSLIFSSYSLAESDRWDRSSQYVQQRKQKASVPVTRFTPRHITESKLDRQKPSKHVNQRKKAQEASDISIPWQKLLANT